MQAWAGAVSLEETGFRDDATPRLIGSPTIPKIGLLGKVDLKEMAEGNKASW